MKKNRKKFTVEMDVTEAQAVALSAFFKSWNSLSGAGVSRFVSFYVDGDGNFRPKCQVSSDWDLKDRESLEVLARIEPERDIERYDYDAISSAIRDSAISSAIKDSNNKQKDMTITIKHANQGAEAIADKNIIAEMYIYFLEKNYIKYKIDIDEHKLVLTVKDASKDLRRIFYDEVGIHRVCRISEFDVQKRRHTTFTSVAVDDMEPQSYDNVRSYVFWPLEYIRVHTEKNTVTFDQEEMKRILNGEFNLIFEKTNSWRDWREQK